MESTRSAALRWQEGTLSVEMGLRSGASLRRRLQDEGIPSGVGSVIESFDGCPGDALAVWDARQAEAGGGRVELPGALGGGHRGEQKPGSATTPAGRSSSQGPPAPHAAALTAWECGEHRQSVGAWDEDIAIAASFFEEAAKEIAASLRGVHRVEPVFEGVGHLYRQSIEHVTAERRARDVREGVRVELRLRAPNGTWLGRIAAARTAEALKTSGRARLLARDLCEALLSQEGATRTPQPTGEMPVILDPRGCGAFLHEIGHFLEPEDGPLAARRPNAGEQVASTGITIIDDPSAQDGRGAYRIDDDGQPARGVVLVEAGRLAQDGAPGPGASIAWKGHGRRASYRDSTLPRLAYTRLLPGEASAESILCATPRGLFVRAVRVGSFDPVSERITLLVSEGHLVERGRRTRPVNNLLLVGTAREWLGAIDAVGSDSEFDGGAGNCIKRGQQLPIRIGLPTLRLAAARVSAP